MKASQPSCKRSRWHILLLSAALLTGCSDAEQKEGEQLARTPMAAGALVSDLRATTKGAIEGPLATLPQELKVSDFRLNPPRVDAMFALPADDGNTDVEVKFLPDRRLEGLKVLTLRPSEQGAIELRRRKTSNVFTGHVAVPFSKVEEGQRRLYAHAGRNVPLGEKAKLPIFLAHEQLAPVDVDLAFNRERIRLLPHWYDVVADEKSLIVTNTKVVEDPSRTYNPCAKTGTRMGPWTFGKLITDMAGANDPAALAESWLNALKVNQVVNGFTIPKINADNVADVLAAWPRLKSGALNVAEAPVKLLAIVNRIDLAGNPSYGPVSGAEGRFVFEFVGCPNAFPSHNGGNAEPFLFILEYGVPIDTCLGLGAYANKWLDLGSLSITNPSVDPTFNDKLQELTDVFATANAAPSKPNGSALNQLRTNQFDGVPLDSWSLREFHLKSDGFLHLATVAQTPDDSYNEETHGPGTKPTRLAAWVNANPAPYTVPLALPLSSHPPFRGGTSPNDGFLSLRATGISSSNLRATFSLNTCGGCHGSEADTLFTHIRENIQFGQETSLSDFLTGETVSDPFDPSIHRTFNDLLRRGFALQDFANATCFKPPTNVEASVVNPLPPLGFRPLLSSH